MGKRLNRIIGTAKRILEQLTRDRRTIGLLIVAPALVIFIYGNAFAGNVEHVKTGYINADQGIDTGGIFTVKMGEIIIEKLDTDKTFDLMDETPDQSHPIASVQKELDLAKARQAVEDLEYSVFIYIGANFSESIRSIMENTTNLSAPFSEFVIFVDGSNPQISAAILSAFREVMQEIGWDIEGLFEIDYVYGGEELEYIDFMAPALIAFFTMFFQLILSVVTIVRERQNGTLERLLATPCEKIDLILGYILGFLVIAIVQVTIILLESVVLFDIVIIGDIWLVYAVVFLFAICSLCIGIMASGIVTTEFQAIQLFPIVILPSFLLSGLFWPVEAIPSALRPFSYIIPLTYATRVNRSIMLRGLGISAVWLDISVLVLFVLISIVLAVITFKEEV